MILKQKTTARGKASLLVALFVCFLFGISQAETTVDELKDSISEKQSKLEQITTEIQNLQKQIVQKQKETLTLKNELALFDLQIRQTEAQIEKVQVEIDRIAAKIIETKITIQAKEEQIERQKTFLAETLRLINEYDSISPLEITLANNTFSELLDQIQYSVNLQEKNLELLNEIKLLKAELEKQQANLEEGLSKQAELQNQLTETKLSLEDQRNRKQNLLNITRGQERTYKSLLTEAAQKQEEIEREIFEIEVSIRQKLGDKTLPPIAGLLHWPMSGILTQGYGNTGFTALGYTFHNGIDIAAPAGTSIYSAGDGLVYATGTGQAAYGNWVVIKHTLSKDNKVFNIYTLYAHLQKIATSTGTAVRAGDLIGYEGNTGNTTRLLYGPERGYHVHFGVYDEDGFGIKDGAYQDLYGPYQIPYGYTYNPLSLLQ